MDKGYQSASDVLKAITPYKSPPRSVLRQEEEKLNGDLSSDRIVVRKLFLTLRSILDHSFEEVCMIILNH